MVDREPGRMGMEVLEEELFEPRWAVGTARENQPPYEARLLVNRWTGEEEINNPLAERDENWKPIRHIVVAANFVVREGRRYFSVRREAYYPQESYEP